MELLKNNLVILFFIFQLAFCLFSTSEIYPFYDWSLFSQVPSSPKLFLLQFEKKEKGYHHMSEKFSKRKEINHHQMQVMIRTFADRKDILEPLLLTHLKDEFSHLKRIDIFHIDNLSELKTFQSDSPVRKIWLSHEK